MRIFDAGGGVVRVEGNGWLGGGEQSAAVNQFLFANSIGEEAEVADADQAGGQHVEQKTANELDRIQGHGLGAGMIGIVFPVKADAAVFQSAKSVVGDGDTVGVASQILEHAPGSTEGRLDVNHPFEVGGGFTQGLEGGRLGQIAKLAGEMELAIAKRLSQRSQEQFAEPAAENFIRKEEGILAAGNPAGAVGREASAGDDTVQVRMKMQVLTPGSKIPMSGWVVEDSRVQLDIRGFGVAGSSWQCAFAWILW